MGYLGVIFALMILWRVFEKSDGQVNEKQDQSVSLEARHILMMTVSRDNDHEHLKKTQ